MVRPRIVTLSQTYKKLRPVMVCATASVASRRLARGVGLRRDFRCFVNGEVSIDLPADAGGECVPGSGEDQAARSLQPKTCSANRALLPLRRGGAVRRPTQRSAASRSGRERRRRTLSRSSTRNESRPQLSFGDGPLLPSIDIRGRRAGDLRASSSEVDALAHGHGAIIRESKIPGRVGGVVGHCQE